MKKKVFFLILGLTTSLYMLGCGKQKEAQNTLETPENEIMTEAMVESEGENENNNASWNKDSVETEETDIEEKRTIFYRENEEQSFPSKEESSPYEQRFVTLEPVDRECGYDAKYVIMLGNKLEQELCGEHFLEDGSRFVSTDVVGFPDLNNDGCDDIVILGTYQDQSTQNEFTKAKFFLGKMQEESGYYDEKYLYTEDVELEVDFMQSKCESVFAEVKKWAKKQYQDNGQFVTKQPTKEENQAAIAVFDRYITGDYYDITEEEVATLLQGVVEIENTQMVGTFERTQCVLGIGGDITLKKKTTYASCLDGDFFCYAATGNFEQETACYLSETKAFALAKFQIDDDISIVFLERKGDELTCVELGSAFPMGMGVCADGIYTAGEVVHTNENIVEETFRPAVLATIKQLLTEQNLDVETYLVEQMLYGATVSDTVTVRFADGSTKKVDSYDIWIPHAALYTMNIYVAEDDHVYMTTVDDNGNIVFMTDDSGVTEMPVVE